MAYLFQDWAVDGHAWVDNRVNTAVSFVERQIKLKTLKGYVTASGRFDIEGLKVDLTKGVLDKKNEAHSSLQA